MISTQNLSGADMAERFLHNLDAITEPLAAVTIAIREVIAGALRATSHAI